jgi:hypothetical protein
MTRIVSPGRRLVAMVTVSWLLIAADAAASGTLGIETDGWHTWQVDAVEDAPAWCCIRWSAGHARRIACDLDNRNNDHNFSSPNDKRTGQMQIYALLKAGALVRVRALGPQCAVRTNDPVQDLGTIAADTSANWLQHYIGLRSDLSTDLMAALAVHRGELARDALLSIATKSPDAGNRRDAIFWLGQVRIGETTDEMKRLVHEDGDAGIREQAIIALAQLPAEEAARALISFIEDRSLDGKTRQTALFWLVESGSDPAMAYLANLFAGN